MEGIFITFEGPDGAGKSTQIKQVADKLDQLGNDTLMTREPGGTGLGESIRGILLDPEQKDLCNEAEILLYAAARAQHVNQVIRPALEAGKVVLCDRFLDSSLAYQGYGRDMGLEFVSAINKYAVREIKPSLTILLDIPPEEGLKRIQTGNDLDRLESENLMFHRKVRQGFLSLSNNDSSRFVVIDATKSVDVVSTQVWHAVASFLGG